MVKGCSGRLGRSQQNSLGHGTLTIFLWIRYNTVHMYMQNIVFMELGGGCGEALFTPNTFNTFKS